MIIENIILLEKFLKALKSPLILLFSVELNAVNHYKIVVPLFGAAYI